MKKLTFLLILFSSLGIAKDSATTQIQEKQSMWFVPESCKERFLDYLGQPYNVRDGVSFTEIHVEDLPMIYKGGNVYEIVYPVDKMLHISLKANIAEIFESCSENAFIKLSKKEFSFSKLKELIGSMGVMQPICR